MSKWLIKTIDLKNFKLFVFEIELFKAKIKSKRFTWVEVDKLQYPLTQIFAGYRVLDSCGLLSNQREKKHERSTEEASGSI